MREFFWLPLFFWISLIFGFRNNVEIWKSFKKLVATIEALSSCGYLSPQINQGQHREPIPRRADEAGIIPGMIEHQRSQPQAVGLANQNQKPTDNRP